MSPYRERPTQAEAARQPPGEEWVLAAVLAVIGAARVIVALATGEDLATEVTIAALLGALGCVLLAQLARRKRT